MSSRLPELLSAALRLMWECGGLSEDEAIRALEVRVRGFGREQYAEARRLAAVLNGAAFELADAWHAAKGREPGPTTEELACLCPGFLPGDYSEAISKNLLWAAK
ncbi:MAG: hypothetical protein JWP89_3097 [Schlesneria sp.]|nr:hypothetical protein [Schlesneria sp.]